MTPDPPAARDILTSRVALLDVRAPVEFAAGAFEAAVNLPLLLDHERAEVGTRYRTQGAEAAVALGHELVTGPVKTARVQGWLELLREHPGALVCCARGGMRSEIAARWLADAGRPTARVAGGFKALRTEALAVLARSIDRDWLILGGKTGSRKTALLREHSEALDIEAAGNHRGSSFGGFAAPQPGQVTFENRLAVELLAHRDRRLLVEDEGRNLGSLVIPEALVQRMRAAPVVVLEVPFEERVASIAADYVSTPLAAGEDGGALCERYQSALLRLRKRLGDERWRQHRDLIAAAFAAGDIETHRAWIAGLLTAYYDPMYEYQLQKKRDRVVLTGSREAVRRFLADRGHAPRG